ncbi:MAG: Maf family protein [Sphingosinicella sp.]|uniref:Maf family protein n=1 Tax=Sphingosinicella sp. TaxID=1917971 RepID=UPI00403813FF
MKLILASQSATRRRMLEAAGVPFEAVATGLDEDQAKTGLAAAGFGPRDMAEMLAELKAKSVAAPADTLVLGADQTLELDDGTMLSKPVSREDALDQLCSLSGRSHWLHSAAAILEDGESAWAATESVELAVRPLGEAFLRDYLDREYEAVRSNVGGYRVEALGGQLFERIDGSHFAIFGLPLLPLLAYLRERGLLAT